MGRPSTLEDKRREFLPVLAAGFAEHGYRRLTSAELAARCGVGENVLYRIWPDKQAMFLAALEWVYLFSERTWERVLADESGSQSPFARLLDYEARHLGEHGLHRIIFAGLSETDDPRIKRALRDLYARFHELIRRKVVEHRSGDEDGRLDPDLVAWAIVGLGTVANVGRELSMLGAEGRRELLWGAGALLADGRQGEKRTAPRARSSAGKRKGRAPRTRKENP
jgi:AcrR family transcriptional regulator